MPKITLDRDTFKALASDTRLEILRVLDGKNLSLNDLMKSTSLNKATLHEHLAKLNEAGLVKRQEREGHKWVFYRLTWKGESLLHPENTRIVVLFTTTFIALWVGIIQLIEYVKGSLVNIRYNIFTGGQETPLTDGDSYHLFLEQYSVKGSSLPSLLPENLQKVMNFIKYGGASPSQHSYSSIPIDGNLSAMYTRDSLNIPTVGNGGVFDSAPEGTRYVVDKSQGVLQAVYQDPLLLYIAVGCFCIFTIVLCVALWRLWANRTPKL